MYKKGDKGHLGFRHSKGSKKKMSEKIKAYWKTHVHNRKNAVQSEESRKKMSESKFVYGCYWFWHNEARKVAEKYMEKKNMAKVERGGLFCVK